MPFDQPTRNALAKMVGECRRQLSDDIRKQLQGTFGLQPDGTALAVDALGHLDERKHEVACELREWQTHLAANEVSADAKQRAAAFERMTRETAFTALNRLAALRLCEERGHVIECVRRGMASDGFQLFERLTGGALGTRGDTYREFLDRMFDELARDIGVLFDRHDPRSLVFPDEQCLEQVLALLSLPALSDLWKEDETIGWIYQYYNDEAERKRMREESSAPRNSRELAVRNQFFTPRYVVEFLTDNTLGRLWYEMTRGETVLRDRCRYLVRRPTESFLKPGESAPESAAGSEAKTGADLSQEELLRQPVHIPYRPLKDPREIRLLDPACGSMHFGLYAFDLFTVIYDEAWEITHGPDDAAKSAETFAPFVTFAAAFPDKAAFLREVPRLIVERNIHGIDIDPRAAQIAGLSLWLRAQRAWHQAGVKPSDRPRITRSNLVCAEPMPGEKELLREFVEQQFAAGERPAYAFLLEAIFDRMTLAGEAGSLLRIEQEIRTAIADAKRLWKQGPRHEQAALFAEPGEKAGQGEMRLDLSGITDEQFWDRAEQRIYDALEAYAQQAESGGGFQRRLFADDAAQGFAFIDLCRKRYDVAVMNPPYGDPSIRSKDYIEACFPLSKYDLYACIVERYCDKLTDGGALGALTSRTGFLLSRLREWRLKTCLSAGRMLEIFADLGYGVLDAAMVQTAAYVIRKNVPSAYSIFRDLRAGNQPEKEHALALHLPASLGVYLQSCSRLAELPGSPFAYWIGNHELDLVLRSPKLGDRYGVKQGIATADNTRFLRLFWEVPPHSRATRPAWMWYNKGGESRYFYFAHHLVVRWLDDGSEVKANADLRYGSFSRTIKNESCFLKPGLSFPLVSKFFCVRVLPRGFVFDMHGPSIYGEDADDLLFLLGYLNTRVVGRYLGFFTDDRSWQVLYVQAIPVPSFAPQVKREIRGLALMGYQAQLRIDQLDETSVLFCPEGIKWNHGVQEAAATLAERIKSNEHETRSVLSQLEGIVSEAFGEEIEREGVTAEIEGVTEIASPVERTISFVIGCVFGRWDIRYATGERPAPELPDPFAPLPVCSPGMLQGDDGLPLSPEAGRRLRAEGRYPLDVAWDGILVDDAEHPLDLERCVHAALGVLWGDRADALEHEACALLRVPSLREWFRRPAGFFADHLKRYSKSRRQAPIYWPLSTAGGSYTLWIYYHRLTDETLYSCVNNFIQPKLNNLERDIPRLRDEKRTKDLQAAVALQVELEDLKQELLTWAPRWRPSLNDGVLVTACPLWKLFGLPKWRKDLEACWKKLEAGDYDWAHLAQSLWPERVRAKCKKDRSLAIAHGLEDLFEVEPPKLKKSKKGRGRKSDPDRQMDLGTTEDAEELDP